jgi:signal transduction histidine kinase
MEIADNGRSFRERPENSHKPKMRLGLLGMQERVRLVNGKFRIEPHPGRGTTVRVAIPFISQGLSLPGSSRCATRRARIPIRIKPARR